LDEAPYKLSGAVASQQAAPLVVWLFPLPIDKPWFLTEGKSCCYIHHTFLLGFPTGQSFTRHQAIFYGTIAREEEEDFCEGSFSHAHPLLCYLFCFTLFYLHRFIKNPKKLESLVVVISLLLVIMLFPKYILEDLSVGSGSIIGKDNIEEFVNHIYYIIKTTNN
jgi:hypothetical protein